MAKLNVNIGQSVNDKTGDTLRSAFDKINQNFTELYTLTGGSSSALTELAQDYASPMFNHASHVNITATYDDANNKILLTGVAAQVQSDWNASSGLGVILNKPTLFSGSYTDLTSKPTIPTSFSSLVNGSHTVSLSSAGLTAFPAISNESLFIQASELGSANASIGISAKNNVIVTANILSTAKQWTFGTSGTLSLPAGPTPLTNVNQIVSATINRTGASTDTDAIATARDTWLGAEQTWTDMVNQDFQLSGYTWPWTGKPSWEGYLLLINYNSSGTPVPGVLPPSSALAPAGNNAVQAYLAYKELVSNIDIVSGNKTFSFENTGALRVPGVITKDNSLILVSSGVSGVLPNDLSASVTADGQYGRVFIRTDNGTTLRTWQFDINGALTFPDGTTTTGKGITVPVDQSLTVNTSYSMGPGGATTFKINSESIKLPTGNGIIFSGTETAANSWGLDSANKTLYFPDAGDGVFPQIRYSTTGNDGMQLFTAAKPIKITTASNTHWTFGTNGRTTFPNGTVPEHSYGAAGDKEGMVVFSDPYIYYCKQDYVDNSTDIWVRVAWTGTNW